MMYVCFIIECLQLVRTEKIKLQEDMRFNYTSQEERLFIHSFI